MKTRQRRSGMAATVLCLAAAGALAGCGTVNGMLGGSSEAQALAQLNWPYEDNAIQIDWRADARLNDADGQPHALLVLVLQMKDPNAFEAATGSAEQLARLIDASTLPPGLLASRRFYVQPGERGAMKLARVEDARYVGVVAAYFRFDAARVVRLYTIGAEIRSTGWLVKQRQAVPSPMRVGLLLGRDGIAGAQSEPWEPAPPSKPVTAAVPLPSAPRVNAVVEQE